MKKFIYIAIGLFATILITSCDDKREYDIPALEVPAYSNSKGLTFITINELKQRYPTTTEYDSYNLIKPGSNLALKAYVSGNDISGNIYKTLYIQDETGSIVIGSQRTGLFPLFPVGQEVIIELDSLAVGRYAGSYQIGGAKPSIYVNRGVETLQMDRMSYTEFTKHVFRNGLPDMNKVEPVVYSSVPTVTENIRGTLVKFTNVEFERGGTDIFAHKGTGGENVNVIIGGKKVIVRTSEYSNFAADIIPEGVGDIVCLLTRYQRGTSDAIQLVLRGREDLHFNKK
jgi:hypothetical protein